MLVDCGTVGNGGVSASKTLAIELDWHSILVNTVVVTHFDLDHWRGLRDLPQHWRHPPVGEVEFRYPALLPGDAGLIQKAHFAFQAIRLSGPIFGALDVIGTWERAGVVIRRRPSYRGDWFFGGGTHWDVHWPPASDKYFDDGMRRRMRALGSETRRLAEEVPRFGEALDAVQSIWFDRENSTDRKDHPLNDITGGELFSNLQEALGEKKFTAFASRISKFTNELSMVHSSEDVVNFGDCEKGGLKALMEMEQVDPSLAKFYSVILAPHHGTAKVERVVQDRFPRSLLGLVSQNGRTRYLKGLQEEQKQFKDAVTNGVGVKIDTYNPAVPASLLGPHVRFWLPTHPLKTGHLH
ncbi:MBL fold metallo-hydrolase [Rathayibacter sp. VKM Ac-2926]|nr:MBL fold metallo-hydrolase [Rathayibacter sp. VKM Ac-2926]